MTKSQTYFYRNRGEWNWNTQFKVLNWRGLWSSDLTRARKISFMLFIFSQKFFGSYKMWTNVIFDGGAMVKHQTRLTKFGFCFMRSEKIFHLKDNGTDLELSGNEFFSPFLWRPHPFAALLGKVLESGTRAEYKMPLFGSVCDCKAVLEPDCAEIEIRTSWLAGKFWLVPESMQILKLRFGPID